MVFFPPPPPSAAILSLPLSPPLLSSVTGLPEQSGRREKRKGRVQKTFSLFISFSSPSFRYTVVEPRPFPGTMLSLLREDNPSLFLYGKTFLFLLLRVLPPRVLMHAHNKKVTSEEGGREPSLSCWCDIRPPRNSQLHG